jgi:hypothetical protein
MDPDSWDNALEVPYRNRGYELPVKNIGGRRVRIHSLMAPRFDCGRVLLAGDAARPGTRRTSDTRCPSHAPVRASASLDRASGGFLGWPLTSDYMCRPPFVYPRWLYGCARDHGERLHRHSTAEHIMSQPPRGISEFKFLGAFAARYHGDAFTWSDADNDPDPPPCRWYWSWEGISPQLGAELDSLTGLKS